MSLAHQTIFNFLERNPQLMELPSSTRIAIPRAVYTPALEKLRQYDLCLQQSFKPLVDELLAHRMVTSLELEGNYDRILFVPTRQKKESLYWIARSYQALTPQGILIVCGENDMGAKSYRDNVLKALGNEINSAPLNKCTIFWIRKDDEAMPAAFQTWLEEGQPRLIEGSELHTQVGIFGWNQIDPGSELLCQNLPQNLPGVGADFGSGYGYLSHYALQHCSQIKELSLYEAEWFALEAAKKNLLQYSEKTSIQYYWCDLLKDTPLRNFDWILMNPPCHDSGKQSFEIGVKFIVAASQALKPGGTLFLVSLLTLPYEKILNEFFSDCQCLSRANAFKVFRAIKKQNR